jgi:hypothetical protein
MISTLDLDRPRHLDRLKRRVRIHVEREALEARALELGDLTHAAQLQADERLHLEHLHRVLEARREHDRARARRFEGALRLDHLARVLKARQTRKGGERWR